MSQDDGTARADDVISVGVRRAARDDSCLFSCVLSAMGDDVLAPARRRLRLRSCLAPSPTSVLRRRCAAFVAADRERFDEGALGMTNGAYQRWIRRRRNWGGETEVVVLSETLKVDIAVWSAFTIDEPLVYRGEDRSGAVGVIHLLYTGTHYDLLVARCRDGTTACRFPVGDARAHPLILARLREARDEARDRATCRMAPP